MLPEIPPDQFAAALDDCAASLLWEAAVVAPPVDALLVAGRLDIVVASDPRLPCRARFARLAPGPGQPAEQGTIVVGPAERPEREQWAVAHEIGESVAYQVFERLGLPPEAAPPGGREHVANCLAGCLLLPRTWFERDGRALDWDLAALKARYDTASHELIALRMLQMTPPVVITVCDLGRVTWRRASHSGRVPPLLADERRAWQRSHQLGLPSQAAPDAAATGLQRIRCWPIHEPEWKREILRSEVADW